MDDVNRPAPAAPDPQAGARQRRGRSFALGGGFAAAVAAVVTVAVVTGGSSGRQTPADPVPSTPAPSTSSNPPGGGPRPQHLELVAYDTCDAMLDGLRTHTANS